MATGYASNAVPGDVALNAAQPAADYALVPQVILDDAVNGSVALHLGGRGAAPGIAARTAGLGTGGTAALDANATDLCGQITLVTGSASWGTGVQATVTYGTAHQLSNYPVIAPASQATGLNGGTVLPSVVPVGLTGFTVNFAVADSAAHTYVFDYFVGGQ